MSSNNRIVGPVLWLILHYSWNLNLLESCTMIIFSNSLIFFLPSVIVRAVKVWSISLTACEISWCLQIKINSLSLRVQHSSILILIAACRLLGFQDRSCLLGDCIWLHSWFHPTIWSGQWNILLGSCVMISSSWLIRVICVYCVGSYCR